MKSANIRMEEQYFTALNVSVKKGVTVGDERMVATPQMLSGLELRSHVTCSNPPDEDPHHFAVTMEIFLDDSEVNERFPYFILVRSVGIFNVKQGAFSDFAARRDGVLELALPRLYAGISDVVASLTARSWAGVVHLPVMEFDTDFQESASEE
ncbi:hypothetical protein [Ralstonia wenshanensis]|uniref:hypothetical protein n=1 Tax=Ralstonia wenshanensis TaxID=2842456 RepID=UPI0029315951|nr:hypothetical protein [Ralstonia wenshanensis]